jgi:hypothetical protein
MVFGTRCEYGSCGFSCFSVEGFYIYRVLSDCGHLYTGGQTWFRSLQIWLGYLLLYEKTNKSMRSHDLDIPCLNLEQVLIGVLSIGNPSSSTDTEYDLSSHDS